MNTVFEQWERQAIEAKIQEMSNRKVTEGEKFRLCSFDTCHALYLLLSTDDIVIRKYPNIRDRDKFSTTYAVNLTGLNPEDFCDCC